MTFRNIHIAKTHNTRILSDSHVFVTNVLNPIISSTYIPCNNYQEHDMVNSNNKHTNYQFYAKIANKNKQSLLSLCRGGRIQDFGKGGGRTFRNTKGPSLLSNALAEGERSSVVCRPEQARGIRGHVPSEICEISMPLAAF